MAAYEDRFFFVLGAEDFVDNGEAIRRDALGRVSGDGLWGGSTAVAREVRDDDAEVQVVDEVRDLIAPAEGEVGPTVEEEDGTLSGGGGFGEEVVVGFGVDGGRVVRYAGVCGGQFVRHCAGAIRNR